MWAYGLVPLERFWKPRDIDQHLGMFSSTWHAIIIIILVNIVCLPKVTWKLLIGLGFWVIIIHLKVGDNDDG